MKAQQVPFEEIYDLFAIRIILDSPPDQEKPIAGEPIQ
jgi:GTP diphosphokinase / guanosine-3',5'-bis(diphosphate) 3'-diphosphatase